MKKIFRIIVFLFVFTNLVFSQNSFRRIIRVSDFSGDTIITYHDNPELNQELPRPRNSKGEIVGIYGFKLSSEEDLLEFVINEFTKEEIRELINSTCIIKFICIPNGEIKSASFEFVNKEPDVCLDKLVLLSRTIKENFTLNVEFGEDVVNDAYVNCSYGLFLVLKRKMLE